MAAEDSTVSSVGQWLGVLLGGTVGAFTFLGIKGEEVGVILRNEPWAPGALALLVALSIGASVVSIFLTSHSMPWIFALGLLLLVLSLAPAMVSVVPVPRTSPGSRVVTGAAGAVIFLSALLLITLAIRTRGDFEGPLWPAQATVLLMALTLSTTAIFGALRLEVRSQYSTTSAQLTGSYKSAEGVHSLSLSVRAEKLRAGDDVALGIYGLPRQSAPDKECADPKANRLLGELSRIVDLQERELKRPAYEDTCEQQPCQHLTKCEFVAGAQLNPDAFGKIQNAVDFPVDPEKYQHLAVTAALCARDEDGQCRERFTTLDMRLPEASPSDTPSTTAPTQK